MSYKKLIAIFIGVCFWCGFMHGFITGYWGETPLVIRKTEIKE